MRCDKFPREMMIPAGPTPEGYEKATVFEQHHLKFSPEGEPLGYTLNYQDFTWGEKRSVDQFLEYCKEFHPAVDLEQFDATTAVIHDDTNGWFWLKTCCTDVQLAMNDYDRNLGKWLRSQGKY